MRRVFSRIASLMRGRRSPTRDRVLPLGLDVPFNPSPDTALGEETEMARRLAALPLFVRETYLLRVVDRMSIDEISSRLAISRPAARRYLKRAIIAMAATPAEGSSCSKRGSKS
jgi:DNA-directed RNA polymerase specialized sigma24 family protein